MKAFLGIIESVISSPFAKAEADSDRIFCTVFKTLCASSLAMYAYQIGEHLHLTDMFCKASLCFPSRLSCIACCLVSCACLSSLLAKDHTNYGSAATKWYDYVGTVKQRASNSVLYLEVVAKNGGK